MNENKQPGAYHFAATRNELDNFVIFLVCDECQYATKQWKSRRLHERLSKHNMILVGRFEK